MVGKTKVFLGGTCNGSKWREELIKDLKIDYFNPVVEDWNEECKKREIIERKNSTHVLYTFTPEMTGVYAIAEAVEDSIKRGSRTVVCVLDLEKFDEGMRRSMLAVAELCKRNYANVFFDLESVANYLNKF